MHIGFVITSLVGGGAEKVVLTLASQMVKKGHLVDIYVLTSKINYKVEPRINVNFLSSVKKIPSLWARLFYRSAVRRFIAIVKRNEDRHGVHDVMFYNLPEDYVLGDMASLENSYYCLHTSVEQSLSDQLRRSNSRYKKLKKRYSALSGKNVVAVSQGVGDELKGLSWLDVKSVQTIYNPFDPDEIRRLSTERIDERIDYKFLIHIGRAARLKRHDLLFSAMKKLPSEYKLVLLSKDSRKLRKMAESYGLSDRVELPGFQENPYKWIKKAELLVLCSDFEGFGNVLVESLICGTPVVSTDCPYGPAEILTGALSWSLCQVGDSDALADKIIQSFDTRINIGKPDILEKVEINHVVDRYLSIASIN